VADGEGLTDPPPDHYRVLQVHVEASTEVIEAAFVVLREKVLCDGSPGAGSRLARLNAAHRTLSRADLRTAYDAQRAGIGEAPASKSP
jgi:DnaJ-class molecular chaperone